jgi:hypothetical protein
LLGFWPLRADVAALRKSQDRTYRGFSTSFRSAPRKLCDAWEDAKGCRTNLAKAEGLKLPSPNEAHHSTRPCLLQNVPVYISYAVTPFAMPGLRCRISADLDGSAALQQIRRATDSREPAIDARFNY